MSAQVVLMRKQNSVAVITLNRPDALNSFNDDMRKNLLHALSDAEKDKTVRAVVITGAGRAFSAGQDLADVKAAHNKNTAYGLSNILRHGYNPIIRKIRTMDKPIVASVNGAAAGAGMSIALACDFRILSDKATFHPAFIKVGLIPDCGANFLLTHYLGLAKALEIMLQGDSIPAQKALELGLATQVVPAEQHEKATIGFATKLARAPTKAVGLTKRAINRALFSSLEESLEQEASLQEIAEASYDHREGVKAFLEKREPQFKGE